MCVGKIVYYVLNRLECGHIVKLELERVNVDPLGLRICVDKCGVDTYLFCLIYADFYRCFINYVNLDGEEKEGRLNKRLCRSLRNTAENEGVAHVELISARFLFDFFYLTLELLDSDDLVLNCACGFLTADSLKLSECSLVDVKTALNVLLNVCSLVGEVKIAENTCSFLVRDNGQGILAARPEEINEFGNLFVTTFEESAKIVGTLTNYALEIKALVISANFDKAFFVVRVNTFSHCVSPVLK